MRVLRMSVFIGFTCLGTLMAQTGNDLEKEKSAVKKVVEEAYVEAVFIKGDAAAVAEGWHPGCDIVIMMPDGRLNKTPAYNFVRAFKQGHPPFDKNARAEFRTIEVSGYAASVVLEIRSGETPVYTDMLLLYKFVDGWKIVSKIYYAYPKK